MAVLRWIIGRIILFFDFIFSPRRTKRDVQVQAQVNANTQHLSLYQLPACPFCVKVRRAMKRDNLSIEVRNINQTPKYREELVEQGGKRKVPCLRIEENNQVTWLYESSDIVKYLEQFVPEKAA